MFKEVSISKIVLISSCSLGLYFTIKKINEIKEVIKSIREQETPQLKQVHSICDALANKNLNPNDLKKIETFAQKKEYLLIKPSEYNFSKMFLQKNVILFDTQSQDQSKF